MSEEQSTQQAYVLSQIRDSMERQVVLMEQFTKEVKASHRRMDGLKKELTKFNDGLGEVSAKLESMRTQDAERNQMLEELGQSKMEDLQLQLNGLGQQLDFIKSNGSRQTGWMENVASTNLEGIKGGIAQSFAPLQQQQSVLQQMATQHMEVLPKQMEHIIEGIERLQHQLDPLQDHLTGIQVNQKEHSSKTLVHLSQLKEKVSHGAASTKEITTWLQHLADEKLADLEAYQTEQKDLQSLPFDAYQYLWNYGQFFTGTTTHGIVQRHQDWIQLEAKGKDLADIEFKRTGWLNTTAPEVVWVLNAYETLEPKKEAAEVTTDEEAVEVHA